jgi:hypothetical protein
MVRMGAWGMVGGFFDDGMGGGAKRTDADGQPEAVKSGKLLERDFLSVEDDGSVKSKQETREVSVLWL